MNGLFQIDYYERVIYVGNFLNIRIEVYEHDKYRALQILYNKNEK